jgi:hypothetical protein
MRWPAWWDWELELTPHVLKRMVDREFTELDLRQMLEDASSLRPDVEEGRWVVTARHRRRAWEIVVEPDSAERVLVVITAYPVVRAVRRRGS